MGISRKKLFLYVSEILLSSSHLPGTGAKEIIPQGNLWKNIFYTLFSL
jgi:hypothetical protein